MGPMQAHPKHLFAKAAALFTVLGLCVVAASCGASSSGLISGDGGSGSIAFSGSQGGSGASTGRGGTGASTGQGAGSGAASTGLSMMLMGNPMCLNLGAACASNGECCSN